MNTHPKNILLEWIVSGGIAIIGVLTFHALVAVIAPAPRFEDFCESRSQVKTYPSEESCVSVGGQWTPDPGVPSGGYCDAQYTCSQKFEEANDSYSKIYFLILASIGIVVFFTGIFLRGSSVVANGLTAAGVIALFFASVVYWENMQSWVRLSVLLTAFVAAVGVTWKRFKD